MANMAGVNEAAADGTLARFPGIARVSLSPDALKALRFPDVALLAGTLSALGTVTKLGALFVDDEDGCSGGEAAAAAHLSLLVSALAPTLCDLDLDFFQDFAAFPPVVRAARRAAGCRHRARRPHRAPHRAPHRDRRTQPRSSNRHRFPPNAPPQCESVWMMLAQLRGLPRLRVLNAVIRHSGAGLAQLAYSADALASTLESLRIYATAPEPEDDDAEDLNSVDGPEFGFVGKLRGLRYLCIDISVFTIAPLPAWISGLTGLTKLSLSGCTAGVDDLPALAELRGLRDLSLYEWTGSGRSGPAAAPPACLPGVTRLGSDDLAADLRCARSNLASLLGAFPGVVHAGLRLWGAASQRLPAPGGAPRWPALRCVKVLDAKAAELPRLIRLFGCGGPGGALRKLTVRKEIFVEPRPVPGAAIGDAVLAELLRELPRLQILDLEPTRFTDAGMARLPAHPALRSLLNFVALR